MHIKLQLNDDGWIVLQVRGTQPPVGAEQTSLLVASRVPYASSGANGSARRGKFGGVVRGFRKSASELFRSLPPPEHSVQLPDGSHKSSAPEQFSKAEPEKLLRVYRQSFEVGGIRPIQGIFVRKDW
jgi:hypothetical protein